MSRRLLLFCLFALKFVCSYITQSPGLVKVPHGGTAVLKCDLEFTAHCDTISWYKLHPRTKQLSATTAIKKEKSERNKQCVGVIHNTTAGDSGTYYCVALQTVISYIGNGSRVIVKEPNSQPTVELYIPGESNRLEVLLQCLVMGVDPSEVRVSWVVSHDELTGWTESGWTDGSDSAVEFTRAQVLVPSEIWMDNVECVAEVDGRTFSQTLKRGSDSVCTWFLYLGFGTAVIIILATVIISLSSCTANRDHVTLRSDRSESRFKRRNDKRGAYTVEESCVTDVQYASVDLVKIRQSSSTVSNWTH